jgi:hypothetical protein
MALGNSRPGEVQVGDNKGSSGEFELASTPLRAS